MVGAQGPGAGALPRLPASAHGVWLVSFVLSMSAWACVMVLFLTSSASVSPIAFWTAAFTWLWLLPRSLDRCERKSLQTAEVLAWPIDAASAGAAWGAEERNPTLRPAAEAVTRTAGAGNTAAPTASP